MARYGIETAGIGIGGAPRLLQHQTSQRGEAIFAIRFKKGRAHLGLKLREGHRQGRWRAPQFLRRKRQGPLFGHGQKHAQHL